VQATLDRFVLGLQVVELSQSTRTAREAARVLGCDPGCVVKSLVFRGKQTDKAYLVETSGANRVDPRRLEDLAGEPVEQAPPEFVEEQTGFPTGGMAPVGHAHPLETIIDEDLLQHAVLWAAAGSGNAMFSLTPTQLLTITRGKRARVAKD
jgi:prolyl-tRNA editing enzyme YbaK/EbsC (Cys-tRNA(Pro) deacylase)